MTVDLPATHPVQALSDAIHEVIRTQTPIGLQLIGDAPTVVVSTEPLDGLGLTATPAAVMDAVGGRLVVADPAPAGLVRTAELRGARWTVTHRVWVHTMIHEQLHATPSGILAAHGSHTDRLVEEAAVDAVAGDLQDQVVRTLTPASAVEEVVPVSYPRCAQAVRVASTVATRSRSWLATAAAGWRMRLLLASPFERRVMLAATGTQPEGVC